MPRRSLVPIPPPLPVKLSPPKERPTSLLDHVHSLTMKRYNGEDERSEEFRALMNTVDTVDAQTGHRKGDAIMAANIIREDARESGIFPDVAAAKLNDIAKKFQPAMRRHDTAELGFSRSARLKLLAAPTPADEHLDATGAE